MATTCGCDLTANGCDRNCCCDPDCTDDDKKLFSACIAVNKAHIEEICVSDDLLFSANGKYQIEGTGSGLLCLYKDNYNARFFYSKVDSVLNSQSFENLAKKYRKTSFEQHKESAVSYENSFRIGDPLFIVFSVGRHQGFLPHPKSFLTSECEDSNPAQFLISGENECARIVRNLKEQCTGAHSWNARSYVEGYKVAPYPSFTFQNADVGAQLTKKGLNDSNDYIVPSVSGNVSELIKPRMESFLCRNPQGSINPCPFSSLPSPSYNESTSRCENVAQDVAFNVRYHIGKSVKITQVNVSFILGGVSKSFLQRNKFHFSMVENITANSTNKTTPYRRSGNPGYITGLPVIVAVVEGEGDTAIIYPSTTNKSVSFTTVSPTSRGLCNTEGDRLPINFGVDFRTGCFMLLKKDLDLNGCEEMQKNIYKVLRSNLPTHVGIFGNASADTLLNWIPLINEAPKDVVSISNGRCTNMHTSILFEFLYASTGFQQNPQRKVVGVHVKYGEARTLDLKCVGLFCGGATEKLELIQSVSFVDVSLTPQAEIKTTPRFRSKAPNDFFYPFVT